jgi:hypothetical protein
MRAVVRRGEEYILEGVTIIVGVPNEKSKGREGSYR